MARAQTEDFFQNFRFRVKRLDGPDFGAFNLVFRSAGIPAMTQGSVEYRDGAHIYTKKQPGIPGVDDVTLERGVVRNETSLYDWILAAYHGKEYRTDIQIEQFHRVDLDAAGEAGVVGTYPEQMEASRVYELKNAYPTNVKLAGDLAGDTEDIAIESMTVVCEEIKLTVKSE